MPKKFKSVFANKDTSDYQQIRANLIKYLHETKNIVSTNHCFFNF